MLFKTALLAVSRALTKGNCNRVAPTLGKIMSKTENTYDNKGARKLRLVDPRQNIVDNMRKLLTAIEHELMDDIPNNIEINRLSDEIAYANCELVKGEND